MDLIAPRLRLLAGRGRGNELIHRVSTLAQLPLPRIRTEPEPPTDSAVTFAVGSLPTHEETADPLVLDTLMRRPCLVSSDANGQAIFTWDELISETANKMLLVHSDDDVPAIFDEISKYRVGGGISPDGDPAVPWLIRRIGVAVLASAGEVLAGTECSYTPTQYEYQLPGMARLSAVVVRDQSL